MMQTARHAVDFPSTTAELQTLFREAVPIIPRHGLF
jgi:hypothetical protein